MELIYSLDIAGTFVFAVSGMLTAANKRFDLFGGIVIAFVTAVTASFIILLRIEAVRYHWGLPEAGRSASPPDDN